MPPPEQPPPSLPAPSRIATGPPALPAIPLPTPLPTPAPPTGAAATPAVRLALAPQAEPAPLLPAPVPIPEPAPPPPPPPALPPAPRPAAAPAATHREAAFPPPLDTALAGEGTLNQHSDEARAAQDMIQVHGAHLGKEWIEQLYEWWVQHSYYPPEAARRQQGGTVKIQLHVDRDGHVQMVGLQSSSGSQWLDAGAQAVFRDQTIPAFPTTTPEGQAEIDLTIDYILIRR